MNIAFLFNSDHESLGCCYGLAVLKRILDTQELQRVNRHMRVSIGDILTTLTAIGKGKRSVSYLVELCHSLYKPKLFNQLIYERIEKTYGMANIYSWLFQNITIEIAENLHSKLSSDPSYLGAMDVDFSVPLQLKHFRNSLLESYRLRGKYCSIYYYLGEDELPLDVAIQECFEQYGFSVDYEDLGCRRTYFDKYDSLKHFKRVEDFMRIFSKFKGLSVDQISNITLNIEEIHPKLFDAFAAAARSVKRSETEEDYAQIALTGRRLLEKIADYLFPPQKSKLNGRDVSENKFKNRLWAYIEQTLKESKAFDSNLLKNLGNEADRLFEVFNTGLHANTTRVKIKKEFVALIIWLSDIIALSPASVRKPYLAYEDKVRGFINKYLKKSDNHNSSS